MGTDGQDGGSHESSGFDRRMTKGQEGTSTGIHQTTVSAGFQSMLCFLCGTDGDESTEGLTGLQNDDYSVARRRHLPLWFER